MSQTQETARYGGGDAAVIAAPRPRWLPARQASPSRHAIVAEHQQTSDHRARDRACRILNVLVATVLLVVASPVLIVVWALVRLTSPGPAIFKQKRVGIDRRAARRLRRPELPPVGGPGRQALHDLQVPHDADRSRRTGEVWASKDDPRITPVGRFLRSTRLDELPQLFNVLKGDMNIVGPRPEQPRIFATLSEELATYRERQKVLPGITGLAQVQLPYDQCIDDVKRKIDLDLEYIRRRSAVEDLMIMARTPAVMVLRKGSM